MYFYQPAPGHDVCVKRIYDQTWREAYDVETPVRVVRLLIWPYGSFLIGSTKLGYIIKLMHHQETEVREEDLFAWYFEE